MECKDQLHQVGNWSGYRINRNILECKDSYFSTYKSDLEVLIETYWNVKEDVQLFMKRLRSINRNILECKDRIKSNDSEDDEVLIETYWNVKKSEEIVTSSPFWY